MRLRRNRKNRMFHRCHIAFGRRIENIANKKIPLNVTVRQKRGPKRGRRHSLPP
ncbi:hypothetical protein [Loktanella atrilutea]|uniref:hypothetical protein n=1 Tax=Loktanella atrilutea TaxID=366533 RepID=UPI003CCBC5E6